MHTRQGRRDIPAGRAPLSRFAAPSSPPPTAGARIPLPFQSFSVFFRVGCPLGFFVPTPGAPVPPGSSSVGGDLQQYGLPSGPPQEWASQANLRTGPSLVKLQTFKRISDSLRPLSGSQLPSPECKGTHLTPLEALLTLYRSHLCMGHNKPFSPAFGHASLRPCSASALQRPLISSYPAPPLGHDSLVATLLGP